MTGEIFTDDQITLEAVLENQYLLIHEVVEISELKKKGITIDNKVIVDSSREVIYSAHFDAMDFELKYVQLKGDNELFKKRLQTINEVLNSDLWLPDNTKAQAIEILSKYKLKRK
jgi:hypothetical protein